SAAQARSLGKDEGGFWRRVIAGQSPTCVAGRGTEREELGRGGENQRPCGALSAWLHSSSPLCHRRRLLPASIRRPRASRSRCAPTGRTWGPSTESPALRRSGA